MYYCGAYVCLEKWIIIRGIKKQGKGLKHFYSAIALSAAILYFRTLCALLRSPNKPRTWCLLRCCHAEAYLGASISVPCATDRSIGLPELRHCKRYFQTDPDVEIQKPNCCCVAPDGQKHVKLKKRASTKFRCQGPESSYTNSITRRIFFLLKRVK